jgi:hypothetical protein
MDAFHRLSCFGSYREGTRHTGRPAKTNTIIRIMQACGLTYPGLTIIVGASGAIPETDGVRAGANGFHRVPWRRPARSARRCGAKDDCAHTDRDELPHVSLLLKGAILLAPHTARKPRSNS